MRTRLSVSTWGALLMALAGCLPEVTFTTTGSTSTGSGGNGSSSTTNHAATSSGAQSSSASAVATTGSGQLTCQDSCSDSSKCLVICKTSDPCDCDGDGYYLHSAACVAYAMSHPGKYLGEDCYDCNASAKPGQMAYFSKDRGDGSFDYTCAGGVGAPQYDGTCAAPAGIPATCSGNAGFQPDPMCGNPGQLHPCKCMASGLNACASCGLDANTSTTATEQCH